VFCWLPASSAHKNKTPSQWIADDEKRLVNFLFKDYNKVIRPVHDKKKAVPVGLQVALAQLIDLVRFAFSLIGIRIRSIRPNIQYKSR
jgi:hypothetical protein